MLEVAFADMREAAELGRVRGECEAMFGKVKDGVESELIEARDEADAQLRETRIENAPESISG